MKVNKAEFVTGAVKRAQWPSDNLPMVAFAGRSNVGKSSLANKLLNRKGLVRVSRTPGRTQEINFFNVNDKAYVVDLPGYGYAKAPVAVRKQWGPMIRDFIEQAPNLAVVVQIMDVRRVPTVDDESLLDWLEEIERPTILVLTKADKLSNNELQKNVKLITEATGLPKDAFTIFSAVDGRGLKDLWSRIDAALDDFAAKQARGEKEAAGEGG